ncbi:hypothetical protein [Magnetovibrio sp.]|uniref:phage major capsid protein n=1 Tax=Magnetovibrio sp. TaxID=2024836 RepID=UPI002F94E9E4
MKTVPITGIIGDKALREAAAGSYQELMDLLQAALRQRHVSVGDGPYPYIEALYPDNVVFRLNGKYYRSAYVIGDDKTVALGDASEVEETFEPAGTTQPASRGVFIEAVGEAKEAKFRIRVIRAGVSGNANFYPNKVLREALSMFDGVRVFVKSDEEHLKGKGKDVRNLVGRLTDPVFIEGQGADNGEIQATLQMLEPDGDVAVKLREAWGRNMTNLFGFSIDAQGPAKFTTHGGRKVRAAQKISKVHSVDLIVEPGAGGEVINLIEAKETSVMDRDEIIQLIEGARPDLLKGKDITSMSDEDLTAIMREAMAPKENKDDKGDGKAEDGQLREAKNDDDQVVTRNDLVMIERRAYMREAVDNSNLPPKAKAKLKGQFADRDRFTEAQVNQAITDETDYLASFTESGAVRGLGDTSRIEMGETRFEKVGMMLDAFFDKEHKDHRHARSFKECYVDITGDKNITGQLRNCDEARLRESLNTASFDAVLGDSITRRMIADYNMPGIYDIWRPLVDVVNVNDFRAQDRTRWGGYGDLPAVAEGDPYVALSSPTDEKVSYSVSKRGGTEDVTLETIKNDDSGVIRRIPTKLSGGAKRTLGKFVMDFLRVPPTMSYDAVALFHASHGNLSATALSAAAFAAARLLHGKQTELDSGELMGIPIKYLIVPADLEETATDLFKKNTNIDETFVQTLKPTIIPVWYWTDATDWVTMADPADIPTLELGFLDGQEEPELFVQDTPNSGSMFSHDKLTYKIRHIYGGAALDHRGVHKAVVA